MTATARSLFFAALLTGAARAGLAQIAPPAVGFSPLFTINSEANERVRLGQLVGTESSASASAFLMRSTSTLTPRLDSSLFAMRLLLPDVRTVHNSGIPYSLDDGPMWAGRGWNHEVTFGARVDAGPLRVIVAPTYDDEENAIFQVIPYPQASPPARSVWANPFHPLPESIDNPLRFGDQRLRGWTAGQSSATVTLGAAAVGFATENVWWGPAIRNAIVLSDNAPGFPHAFLQTAHPIHTRIGTLNGQWIVGQLAESKFFDFDTTNDRRSLSGAIVSYAPALDSNVTVGLARLIIGAQDSKSFLFRRAFDIVRSAGHVDADTTSAIPPGARSQITSLFARWVLPTAGFESYAEWARFEEPISLRDYLETPGHSEAYTLGLQWTHPVAPRRIFQLQGELSYLEPDPSLRLRWVPTTYTSRGVPQGFTQRGQVLGAAIGPGASSQWLAADVFAPRWRFGVYANRIRWDNGVLFEPIVPQFKHQDVSLLAGLRGSVSWKGMNLLVDFAHAARFDYLFQTYVLEPPRTGGIDLLNNTLSVTLSSALVRP